jgi:hypothetical protein
MTREEFYTKYGDVKVKFTSYYKYTFTYAAELDNGYHIFVGYGGNSDEIYRFGVAFNSEETIKSLCPYEGRVTDNKGVEVESFFDY